ncbi:MAG: TIGR02301 family protein [Maricaulaceae bacterium]
MFRFLLIGCIGFLCFGQMSHAQDIEEVLTPAQQAILDEREKAELRVEDDMVQMSNLVEALAKNLGQLHFLRTLCYGRDDQFWRERTAGLLSAEAANDEVRKSQLIRAFNAGYYQEKERFQSCSRSVSVDAAAIAENARNIATMLGDPYRER